MRHVSETIFCGIGKSNTGNLRCAQDDGVEVVVRRLLVSAVFLCWRRLCGRRPSRVWWFGGAAQGQGAVGDVFGDAAAGGDVGAGADGDGGDEGGVGADEGAVADGGEVLVDAVVVAGDGACADVDAGADDGVAEVVQVVGLGAFAEGGFFGFDEVADVGSVADAALGAEVGVGAEDGVVGDLGGVEDAAVADGDVVAERASSG